MECERAEVSLVFVEDSEIWDLNKRFRSQDKATDVLSFPAAEISSEIVPAKAVDGDIVISIETASRQSKEFECSVSDRVLRLVIHGILHLAGFEHEGVSAKEAKRMFLTEDRLFNDHLS